MPARPSGRPVRKAVPVSGCTEAAKAPGADAVGQPGTTVVNPPELH